MLSGNHNESAPIIRKTVPPSKNYFVPKGTILLLNSKPNITFWKLQFVLPNTPKPNIITYEVQPKTARSF